jgi:hypothetical protein
LGLLIEQSITNLFLYSQTLNNAGAWAIANATLIASANIAPDGTQTMYQLIPSASSAFTNLQQAITATAQAYTTSYYVKYNGIQFVQILFGGGLTTNYANFDLINGIVTGGTYTSATITSVGNGVYRITTTNTFAATTSGVYLSAIPTGTSARTTNYTGNGYSGIYIWGAQLEALSFPTSYIATTSVALARGADSASMTGTNFSSWFNIAQGTFFTIVNSPYGGRAFAVDGGPNPRLIDLNFTGTQWIVYTNVGGGVQSAILTSTGTVSVATTYGSNGVIGVGNGNTPITITSSNAILTASQANKLEIGAWNGSSQTNGWIKKLVYYPVQFTSAENQEITS